MRIIDLWLKSEEKREKLVKIQEQISRLNEERINKEGDICGVIGKALNNIVSRRTVTNINAYKNEENYKIFLRPDGLGIGYVSSSGHIRNSSKADDLGDYAKVFKKEVVKKLLEYIKKNHKREIIKIIAKALKNLDIEEERTIKEKVTITDLDGRKREEELEIDSDSNIRYDGSYSSKQINTIYDYATIEQVYSNIRKLMLKRIKVNKKIIGKRERILERLKTNLSPYLFAKEL